MTDVALLSMLFGDGSSTRNLVASMGGTRTAVYLALLHLRSMRGPTFTARVSELSILTRYGDQAVRRALTGLVAIGLIRRGPTNGDSRSYTIVEKGSGEMHRTPSPRGAAMV